MHDVNILTPHIYMFFRHELVMYSKIYMELNMTVLTIPGKSGYIFCFILIGCCMPQLTAKDISKVVILMEFMFKKPFPTEDLLRHTPHKHIV